MRLVWLTDIHLNFLDPRGVESFYARVAEEGPDTVLISGDIAEAPSVVSGVEGLIRATGAPALYVLGNHDFYRGNVADVRASCRASDGTYLHGAAPVALSEDTAVIGVDGWADGRFGSARESDLVFTDWVLIDDFARRDAVRDVDARLDVARRLADESAETLSRALDAAAGFRHVIVVTHVPPFARSAGDDGSAYAKLWVPWLACKATGEVLLRVARRRPHQTFEVLCGHTHIARTLTPLPNLRVRTGPAEYRKPSLAAVWET